MWEGGGGGGGGGSGGGGPATRVSIGGDYLVTEADLSNGRLVVAVQTLDAGADIALQIDATLMSPDGTTTAIVKVVDEQNRAASFKINVTESNGNEIDFGGAGNPFVMDVDGSSATITSDGTDLFVS